MGKYMRKEKSVAEVARMELSQSPLGVRTRARTLALRRQQKSDGTPAPISRSSPARSGSYLQLRSRRLPKSSKQKRRNKSPSPVKIPNPNFRPTKVPKRDSRLADGVSPARTKSTDGKDGSEEIAMEEASFGDNALDLESRTTRESTPSSLVRESENVRTPCSATRTNSRPGSNPGNPKPTSLEIDEFLSMAEARQQRAFIEKYNFDPVTDRPLSGRFQWEKLGP